MNSSGSPKVEQGPSTITSEAFLLLKILFHELVAVWPASRLFQTARDIIQFAQFSEGISDRHYLDSQCIRYIFCSIPSVRVFPQKKIYILLSHIHSILGTVVITPSRLLCLPVKNLSGISQFSHTIDHGGMTDIHSSGYLLCTQPLSRVVTKEFENLTLPHWPGNIV